MSIPHRIVRYGYTEPDSYTVNCNPIIKKNMVINDSLYEKIGSIKVGQFLLYSNNCTEEDAMNILTGEGCSANAKLINITDEKRPNFLFKCYRCKADFYKIKNTTITLKSDSAFSADQVSLRTRKDHKKEINRKLTGYGIMGALFIALMIYLANMK